MSKIFDELFVLELANNHWGKLERGLKIIHDYTEVVHANGVRAAIKLQFRDVDTFIHPDYRESDARYIKKTLATQMPWQNYQIMCEAIRAAGMMVMATPFDEISVDKCVEFGVDIIKISSADIRAWPLIKKIVETKKPVIVSTGGASTDDIDALHNYFFWRGIPLAINHCVSLYPSEDADLELNQIDLLRERYPNHVIGFSTHEYHNWHPSVMMAYAKGARTFERHIDIEFEGVPVSPYCSLPHQADQWFKAFLKAKEMCGGPASKKREIPVKEAEYLQALQRGMYAKHDLPAGHILTADDCYFTVPLLEGQLPCGALLRHVPLTSPVTKHSAITLKHVEEKCQASA